jgi:hypothetical protein
MTNLINNNNLLLTATNLKLDSFITGQGKTNDLDSGFKVSDKIRIEGLSVWCNGDTLTFADEAHKNAYFTNLLYKSVKDLPQAQIERLFSHVSKGYLSLNHKDSNLESLPDYTNLFESINYTSFKRVSIKSKLYILEFEVNTDNVFKLIEQGFKIHSPILNESYNTVGFNIELPPKKD